MNKEDIAVVNTNTRIENIKNIFIKNKKLFIVFLSIVVLLVILFFSYLEIKKKNTIKLANKYNETILQLNIENKISTTNQLIDIIKKKNKTYSPLALYFILDNNLVKERDRINELFNIVIDETNLELEIQNLVIYKKALYNADYLKENELINILSPIIISHSIWESHALHLLAEYFYSKNEKKKSKEFYEKILNLPNSNSELKLKSQKRLNRDLSD
jgi:predicted negative regulator of RcsB-dependent stress response